MKRANDIRITSPNVDLDSLPEYLRKDCILFYCKEAEPLARKIASISDKVELGDVNWQCALRCPFAHTLWALAVADVAAGRTESTVRIALSPTCFTVGQLFSHAVRYL
jgi:hypothetical protein